MEFHKKNVRDKKVLCFFFCFFAFFAVCSHELNQSGRQTLSTSGVFPGSYKANMSIANMWIVKSLPLKFLCEGQ